jgi:hypothetical protein
MHDHLKFDAFSAYPGHPSTCHPIADPASRAACSLAPCLLGPFPSPFRIPFTIQFHISLLSHIISLPPKHSTFHTPACEGPENCHRFQHSSDFRTYCLAIITFTCARYSMSTLRCTAVSLNRAKYEESAVTTPCVDDPPDSLAAPACVSNNALGPGDSLLILFGGGCIT